MTIFLFAHSRKAEHSLHTTKKTTTTKTFSNIPVPVNPLSTNTSLPFFMGERRRNHKLCFFCDERFLYSIKGDPHQQRLFLCYQLHAHHYHYLFVPCLQTNNTILFFFLFFVNMNEINRKKIE